MSNLKSDTELITAMGVRLNSYPVGETRAAELARELRQLHQSTIDQANGLSFDDEPANFVSALSHSVK